MLLTSRVVFRSSEGIFILGMASSGEPERQHEDVVLLASAIVIEGLVVAGAASRPERRVNQRDSA